MDRDDVAHDLAQVVEDPTAGADAMDEVAEGVIEQHDVGGLARDVGAAPAHREPDVRGLRRRRVIDAVAGHRDLDPGRARLGDRG